MLSRGRSAYLGILLVPCLSYAELTPLDDASLGDVVGQSGLAIDINAAIEIGSIEYTNRSGLANPIGGVVEDDYRLSFEGVRIGELDEQNNLIGAAPIENLTIDVGQRTFSEYNALALPTVEAPETQTALIVGLPQIQNLDIGIDSVRIGDTSIGGFRVDDLSTFISNDSINFLNQRFDRNYLTGSDVGAGGALGYEFAGSETVISGLTEAARQAPLEPTRFQIISTLGGENPGGTEATGTITADIQIELLSDNVNNGRGGFLFSSEFAGSVGSLIYQQTNAEGEQHQLAFSGVSLFDVANDGSIIPFRLRETRVDAVNDLLVFDSAGLKASLAVESIDLGEDSIGSVLISDFELDPFRLVLSGINDEVERDEIFDGDLPNSTYQLQGLRVSLEQVRLNIGEIRYAQETGGSFSLRNVNVNNGFFTEAQRDDWLEYVADTTDTISAFDVAGDFAELNGPGIGGLSEQFFRDTLRLSEAASGLEILGCLLIIFCFDPSDLLDAAQRGFINLDRRGNPLNISTLNIGLVAHDTNAFGAQRAGRVDALRVALPDLTAIRYEVLDRRGGVFGTVINQAVTGLVVPFLRAAPLGVATDLYAGDSVLGSLSFQQLIDLYTEFFIYGDPNPAYQGGLAIDTFLGIGFREINYSPSGDVRTDDPERITLNDVRIGQVEVIERDGINPETGREFLGPQANQFETFTFGAPVNYLTFNLDGRDVVDLTTGETRETTALIIGLPEIINLDFLIGDIEIAGRSIGGLELHNINTLITGEDFFLLQEQFGEKFDIFATLEGLGKTNFDAGVDRNGNSTVGIQLGGAETLITPTSEGGIQVNAQFGGTASQLAYRQHRSDGEDGVIALNDLILYSTEEGPNGNGDILQPFQANFTFHTRPNDTLEFGNINARGSLAIGSVTIGDTSLGALHIDNFQLRNSHITIGAAP